VKRGGIEIGTVGPNQSMDFGIDSHLIENGQVAQWTEKLSGQDGQKIDQLFGVVIELDPQGVIRFYLE
jgi:hypothetical protein